MELIFSESDLSSEIIPNTSTEVLLGDNLLQDIETSQDDIIHEDTDEGLLEMADVPDNLPGDNFDIEDVPEETEETIYVEVWMDSNEPEINPSLDAEEYVQQFSPEEPGPVHHQEGVELNVDVPDEDNLSLFLQSFIYDQHIQPHNKDIIFFYDIDDRDFVSQDSVQVQLQILLQYSVPRHTATRCRSVVPTKRFLVPFLT